VRLPARRRGPAGANWSLASRSRRRPQRARHPHDLEQITSALRDHIYRVYLVSTMSKSEKKLILAIGAVAAGVMIYKIASRRSDPEAEAIRKSVRSHERRGAIVLADLKGHLRPPTLFGYIPDVYAIYRDGKRVIEEMENVHSISRTHARRQAAAFEKYARKTPGVEFRQVIVEDGRGGRS